MRPSCGCPLNSVAEALKEVCWHLQVKLYGEVIQNDCSLAICSFSFTSHSFTHMTIQFPYLPVQFSCSVVSCNPMDCSTRGLPVHHQHLEFTQTHVHRVGDAIQPSHPLSSPSPATFNLSKHQNLFKWLSSSNQVAKVWEFQLQNQSFQWIFRTALL